MLPSCTNFLSTTHQFYSFSSQQRPQFYGFPTHFFLFPNYQENYQQRIASISNNSQQQTALQSDFSVKSKTKKSVKRIPNHQREIVSAKKNSESNIINHYFNYFGNPQGSYAQWCRLVHSVIGSTNQVENIISCINSALQLINLKRRRTYINKAMILSSFSESELNQNFPAFTDRIKSSNICKISELSQILRKSFYLFIREASLASILTSKRTSIISKRIHIEKRRNVLQFMDQKPIQK